jgi:hypothetical protein
LFDVIKEMSGSRPQVHDDVRRQVLQVVVQCADAIRPVVAGRGTGNTNFPLSAAAAELARRISTAYVHAGRALLEGNLTMNGLYNAAAEQYSRAANIFWKAQRQDQHCDLALVVADRLMNRALSMGQNPTSMPASTYILTRWS